MRYPLKMLYNLQEEELIMSRQKNHHTNQFKLDAINYRTLILHKLNVQKI